MGRLLTASFVALAAALFAPGATAGAPGTLLQVGCVQDKSGGPVMGCIVGRGLRNTAFLAISPNGLHVYATARDADAVAVFQRNPRTGELEQLPGETGCLSDPGPGHDPTCGTAGPLDRAYGIAVAPDGRHVYVAARDSDAVTEFARNPDTGALTPVGCVAHPSAAVALGCDPAPGLDGPVFVAVAPDGGSLLVAAWEGSAVLTFMRDPESGGLAATACVVDRSMTVPAGCMLGDGLQSASSVAISPDGHSVYVSGPGSSAIASFARDPATGAITQFACTSGDGVLPPGSRLWPGTRDPICPARCREPRRQARPCRGD